MRNGFMAGAAGLILMVGAVGVANAAEQNPNVPNWSPYAIIGFGGSGPVIANPGYGGNPGYPPRVETGLGEGRSAYIDPGYSGGWAHPAGANTGAGDDPTGYDNSRQNSAYPPVPGTSY
jgi:hypothetical protein